MTFLWFCSFSWLFRNFIYFMILLEFLFSMFMAIRDLVHFHDFLRLCLIFINFFGDFISFLWHFFWDNHFHELYFPFFPDLEIINFGVFNNFHEESNVSMTLEEKHMHFFFIVDYTIASLKMIWEMNRLNIHQNLRWHKQTVNQQKTQLCFGYLCICFL